jgi:hypothetical protein
MVEQSTNEPPKEDPTLTQPVADVVDVEMTEEAKPEEEKPQGQSISTMVN